MPIVRKIITNSEGLRPVLVDFQNGKIKSAEEYNLGTALYKTKDDQTIVTVTNSNMLYTGVIENEDDLYNNFILVHNKRKNKIRLIQIDCCTVSPLLNKKTELLNLSVETSENAISELNKQFGSKKAKRSIEQRERLTMNINTVKAQLEKTIADIKMDELDYAASSENESLYRPKINRDASTREQVYNLEDLVPRNVLSSLSNEASSIGSEGNVENFGLNSYASTHISHILKWSNNIDVDKIEIFLYINYLINFITTPMKNITRKFVACDKSSEVNNHILDNFSVNTANHRNRPLSMKDKALCYILILSAITLDYQVDIVPLSKILKIGIKKILDVSKVLAFTLTKNENVVILKLPLPPPVSISTKRKRR